MLFIFTKQRVTSREKGGTSSMTSAATLKIDPHYIQTFVQRQPKYAIKLRNGKWHTKHKPLADPAIQAHLEGKYDIATVSPWYPKFACVDIDSATTQKVYKVMESLGLNSSNSLVCESESINSYHIYFVPKMNDNPPTTKLLNECLATWALEQDVEIYPQAKKCFRLPFSPIDRIVTHEGESLSNMNLSQKMYWFNKLDEFDLAALTKGRIKPKIPQQQTLITVPTGTYERGIEYLITGLTEQSSRNHAQFCVLYYFWRENYTVENAITSCFRWIKENHNGFSKDIINPRKVQAEIGRQAKTIWNNYECNNLYPDSTHNLNYGYITKADLIEIIHVCEGNLPRVKFMGELIRYCNPRQARSEINIHSDRLKAWSSKTSYIQFIDELQRKGIIESRSNSYKIGERAKSIKFKWDFQSPEQGIRADNRTTETLESIANSFAPRELQQYLQAAGVKNDAARKQLSAIYVNSKKRGNIVQI